MQPTGNTNNTNMPSSSSKSEQPASFSENLNMQPTEITNETMARNNESVQLASFSEKLNMQPTKITNETMTRSDELEQRASFSEHLDMEMAYDNKGLDIIGEHIKMESVKDEDIIDAMMQQNMGDKETSIYDPYLNRDVECPTSYYDTLIHLLKASLGTGILAMPNAFKNSGFLVGIVGTILIGILCTHTIRLLVKASYLLAARNRVPSLTYASTVHAAFDGGPKKTRKLAPLFRTLTDMFLLLYQIGSSSVYVVFISSNLQTVGKVYFNPETDERMYMLYILIPLILISSIRNLKLLSPFSGVANLFTGVSLTMILYYLCRDLTFNDFQARESVGVLKNIPLFFGTVLFAMEAIGMVLPLENEMKKPQKFISTFGVLNMSMFPITVLYTVVGLLGYLKYGEAAKGSITLDLPEDELLSQIIKILLSLSIYMCYALSNYVAFDILWKYIEPKLKKDKYLICWEYVLRTSIVLITFIFGYAVPNLEKLISLIGAFCLPFVGLALPAIVNVLTLYKYSYTNSSKLRFVGFCLSNLLIVTMAILAFAIGVYVSVSDIFSSE